MIRPLAAAAAFATLAVSAGAASAQTYGQPVYLNAYGRPVGGSPLSEVETRASSRPDAGPTATRTDRTSMCRRPAMTAGTAITVTMVARARATDTDTAMAMTDATTGNIEAMDIAGTIRRRTPAIVMSGATTTTVRRPHGAGRTTGDTAATTATAGAATSISTTAERALLRAERLI